jgi:hypothetical protein
MQFRVQDEPSQAIASRPTLLRHAGRNQQPRTNHGRPALTVRAMRPNPSLKAPTRYGSHRLAAPGRGSNCPCAASRRLPPPVVLARTLGLMHEPPRRSDIVLRMRSFPALLLVLALAACSSTEQNKATAAAATPLNDLNLVNAPIPEVLQAAQRGPYQLPTALDCAALAAEIKALDEVLGPDLDAPNGDSSRGLLERGADEASGAAVGAIQRTAEGVIPFRGWIRKLTGAERYSKRVAAAITAGGVRRAFLKGVRASRDCAA